MSLLTKVTSSIFGIGAISITSLALPNKVEVMTSLPPPTTQPIVSTVQESVQQLIKAGYKGCVNLKNGTYASSFYVCVKTETNGSNLPFFFYYDKHGGSSHSTNKFPQVSKINKNNQSLTIQLTKGGSKTLSSSHLPAWLRNSQYYDKNLEGICKFDPPSGSSLTLKCSDKEVQKSIQI